MKIKRLSPDEFARVSALVLKATKIEEASMEVVRAVLVEGRAKATMAKELGVSRQRVSNALATFWRGYVRIGSPSMGYVTPDIEMPERLAFELDSLMTKVRACEDLALQAKAVGLVLAGIDKARAALRGSS